LSTALASAFLPVLPVSASRKPCLAVQELTWVFTSRGPAREQRAIDVQDLLLLFAEYGFPTHTCGDVESISYVADSLSFATFRKGSTKGSKYSKICETFETFGFYCRTNLRQFCLTRVPWQHKHMNPVCFHNGMA
jgi:hypothetical protein